MPRLSVITPCYNGEEFLGRTIESVIAQSLGDWEMIVVDDGSSDRSAEVAESYGRRDPRVRCVRQSNQYLSRARNNGFTQVSPESRYLLFLDADDVLLPHAFETMSTHLDAHPEAGAAYNLHRLIDDNDLPLTSDDDPPSGTMRFEPIFLAAWARDPSRSSNPRRRSPRSLRTTRPTRRVPTSGAKRSSTPGVGIKGSPMNAWPAKTKTWCCGSPCSRKCTW